MFGPVMSAIWASVAGKLGVVGNKALGARHATLARAEDLLDHGMPPLGDFEGIALADFRPAVGPVAGQPGPAGEDVGLGHRLGRPGQGRRLPEDGGDQLLENLALLGQRVVLSMEDFALLLAQGVRHVASPPTVVWRLT